MTDNTKKLKIQIIKDNFSSANGLDSKVDKAFLGLVNLPDYLSFIQDESEQVNHDLFDIPDSNSEYKLKDGIKTGKLNLAYINNPLTDPIHIVAKDEKIEAEIVTLTTPVIIGKKVLAMSKTFASEIENKQAHRLLVKVIIIREENPELMEKLRKAVEEENSVDKLMI